MDEASKSLVVFDRYHIIGGVWEFYGNDYSRVNTSEKLDREKWPVESCNSRKPAKDRLPRA